MKLHSEISSRWVILYAFILASISGRNVVVQNALPSVKTNVRKDSLYKEDMKYFRDGIDHWENAVTETNPPVEIK